MFKVKNTRRQKRSVSPQVRTTEDPATVAPTPPSSFDHFFDAETTSASNKPWLYLERGTRLQRFRAFADSYPDLTEEERAELNRVLVKANDAKLLNTKQQVLYEDGVIQSIRGLKKVAATFKIDPVRPTKKKVREDGK
jgi:hypothetical protein